MSLVSLSGSKALPSSSIFIETAFSYFFSDDDHILNVASSEQVAYWSLLFGNTHKPQTSLVSVLFGV